MTGTRDRARAHCKRTDRVTRLAAARPCQSPILVWQQENGQQASPEDSLKCGEAGSLCGGHRCQLLSTSHSPLTLPISLSPHHLHRYQPKLTQLRFHLRLKTRVGFSWKVSRCCHVKSQESERHGVHASPAQEESNQSPPARHQPRPRSFPSHSLRFRADAVTICGRLSPSILRDLTPLSPVGWLVGHEICSCK